MVDPAFEEEEQDRLAQSIPDAHRQVLAGLGSHICYPMSMTCGQARMPLKEYRKALHELRLNGLVEYGHLTQEDTHQLAGKGYWRNRRGSAVLQRLNPNWKDHEYPDC